MQRASETPKQSLLLCVLLTFAVLVGYGKISRNEFIAYDDDAYITDNLHVRAGLTRETVKWAFTTFDQANWHPLTWLSHAFDCKLFGLRPAAHHYVNVLLHACNAVLLFLLLQASTDSRWRSLMVAALFALHPVNVESVAWAAERKNVLSLLFLLLAFHAYIWYVRRQGYWRYTVVGVLFALGLLTKPQVITFPLLLLLWDYWPLGRVQGLEGSVQVAQKHQLTRRPVYRLVLEKIPLLLLSLASAVITIKAQRAGGAVRGLSELGFPLRLQTAVISYARYVGKLLWPAQLVALYPYPTKPYPASQIAGAALLIVLISAWVIRWRSRPYLATGWLWCIGSLVPMIGLVQVGGQAMADRYAYISFIGLFVMLVWLAADLAHARGLGITYLVLPGVVSLLVLGALTYKQVSYWHDTESFWQRTLALTHNNYVAEDHLGDFLLAHGRGGEAAQHFRAALAIRHDDLPASLYLGAYEQGRGNLLAAIDLYQNVALHAINIDLRATAYGNLGSAYRQTGQLSAAKESYDAALQLTPKRTMAMIGLGLIAQTEGDLKEAVQQYSLAMTIQPTDVGFLLLAQALEGQGKIDEAKAIYDRVARFSPDIVGARQTVESLLAGRK